MFFGNTDRAIQREILLNTRAIMATVKAIQDAVSTITTDFVTYSTEVDAKLTALQDEIVQGNNPALDDALKSLTDLHDNFKPKIAALATTAEVPVPPAIQPQPDAPSPVSGT